MKQTIITKGGQVSIPADVRHRWGTRRLLLEDRGSELAFRPLPDDPIAAASGAFERDMVAGPSAVDAIREARIEDAGATHARLGQASSPLDG